MKMKASADYGIRAVFYLATSDCVCSSKEISEEMSIPRDYLIQLALRLRDAGILKARPGKNGGYELAKPAEKISVLSVMEALDIEDKQPRHPLTRKKSNAVPVDSVRYAQKIMSKSYTALFGKMTIADLVDAFEQERVPAEVVSVSLARAAQ